MSLKLNRGNLGLALFVVALPSLAIAEDAPEQAPVGLVAANSDTVYFLNQAKKLLAAEYYSDAIPCLDTLLENASELAFPTDQNERNVLRNLRVEAERMIGKMPPAGRQSYELTFGSEARWTLERAVANYDLELLAETSRRFFHTAAGREATQLMAELHLRHGRPLDAAAWFERSRRCATQSADQDNLALQTAIAWTLAGYPKLAATTLSELKARNPDGEIAFGDRTVRLFDTEEQASHWLQSLIGISEVTDQQLGADSDILESVTPTAVWEITTSSWAVPIDDAPFSRGKINVRRQIDGLAADFTKHELPAVPATRPLVVDDVVLMRTPTELRAATLATGAQKWIVKRENQLEKVRRGDIPPLPGDRGSILDPMLRDRVFENETFGGLVVENGLVFCVEDLGFASATSKLSTSTKSTPVSHPLAAKSFNRLTAYSVANGKRKWHIGGEKGEDEPKLAGHFFLGSPLPLAGSLYCLAESSRRIRLVVIDAMSGELRWAKWLQEYAIDVTQDAARSQAGLIPSHDGGILICPTGSGIVSAIDLATRQILWSYRYRELPEGNATDRVRMLALARLAAAQGIQTTANKPKGHWLSPAAILSHGRVILTARDSDELLCLNLTDGSLVWKQPKGTRSFIGGVYEDKLIVVGNSQIELLQVETGKSVWLSSVEIPLPSGRGLLIEGRYLVPLSTAEIGTLDLTSGKILSRLELNHSAGNLVATNRFIASQTPHSVVCLKSDESKKANSE